MQEIKIDENTRGVLVLAVPNDITNEPWVILIESTTPRTVNGIKCYDIFRHASYCITNNGDDVAYVDNEPGRWGNTRKYKFYKPNKKQRDLLKNFMARNCYRFDKENNKVIYTGV